MDEALINHRREFWLIISVKLYILLIIRIRFNEGKSIKLNEIIHKGISFWRVLIKVQDSHSMLVVIWKYQELKGKNPSFIHIDQNIIMLG